MKKIFTINNKMSELAGKAKTYRDRLRRGINKSARIACEAMEEAAKAHTPHRGDGKRRGFNVIRNSLQDSWKAEYTPSHSKNRLGNITLTNSKPYAKFVQNGHRVKRHFVPWLYIDNTGTLSYETNHGQPMFGLIVGTKTPFVKGVDMIGPAEKAFNDTFETLTQKLFGKLEEK